MPLYEYHCHTCGEDFEKIMSFSKSDVMPECPHCGDANTSKKISKAASFGFSSIGSSASSSSSCGSSGGFT